MRSMKRVRLVVLFLIVAALMAGTSATVRAGKSPSLVIQLTPVAPEGDPDYDASGTATLSDVTETGNPAVPYQGRVTVNCTNLTPGARYWVNGATNGAVFTASPKGMGRVAFWDGFDPSYPAEPAFVTVYRIDEPWHLVLEGNWPF